MTKDEILYIAEKHGCTRSAKHFKAMNDVFYLYEFSLSELAEFARACEKVGIDNAEKINKREVLLKAAASLYEFAVDNIHYPSRDMASMLIEKLRDIADE